MKYIILVILILVLGSTKTGAETSRDMGIPNPHRPYFDGCGNMYDYLGNQISKGSTCDKTTTYEAAPEFEGK